MKRISGISAAMVLAVAVYFAFAWGIDAWRIFASPTFGLDDALGSQAVFALGRYLGLAPAGLIKLGAVFGALKATVAAVCALHVFDRLRSLFGGTVNLEVAQAGFMLAVSTCVVALLPMLIHQNPDVVREYAVDLALAGVAAALAGSGRAVVKPVLPRAAIPLAGSVVKPAATAFGAKAIDPDTFDARAIVAKALGTEAIERPVNTAKAASRLRA